ncbi:MAG: hypothetical protein GY804_00070 [Alphaproteobacteria bacterium]|nr:hypothetical protein [Alphaproteobacteria bacterium]
MSEFILGEPSKKGFTKGKINDVTFLYVSIQEPRDKYESEDKEFSAQLVVDQETAKAFKKKFPKNGYHEYNTANFEEQFGIAPPFPDERQQYVIKLTVNDFHYRKVVDPLTGEEVKKALKLPYDDFKRPKVFIPADCGGVNDVTKTVLVGNGSKGHVAFWIMTHEKFGDFPKLHEICVTDLIIYENRSKSSSEWGTVANAAGSSEHFSSQQQENEPELDEEAPY